MLTPDTTERSHKYQSTYNLASGTCCGFPSPWNSAIHRNTHPGLLHLW